MRTILPISLSLSLIACQENSTEDNSPRLSDTGVELNNSMERVPQDNQLLSYNEKSEALDLYIDNKVKEQQGKESHVGLGPSSHPVDADCIYGGIIEGELTLETPKTADIILDLFDDTDLHIYEIESTLQAMANGQDTSPLHELETDGLELELYAQYIDFSETALMQATQNSQDTSPIPILSESLEMVLHKEYIDLQFDFQLLPDGQGKLRGDWYICPQ